MTFRTVTRSGALRGWFLRSASHPRTQLGALRGLSSDAAASVENEATHQWATPSVSAAPTNSSGKRLSVVRPDLLDDWIPEMNDVDVQTVRCSSPVRAWWHCARCQTNYQATVKERLAKEAACCPACHGHGVDTEPSTGVVSSSDHVIPLSESHPHLVAMWDSKRNGNVTPQQITADSTMDVWWVRTVPTLPTGEAHFRRPVFAMVRDADSPQEKRLAQASFEEAWLQRIHDIAHVEAAEPSTMLPRSSRLFASDSKVLDGALRSLPSRAYGACPVSPGSALNLWKQRVLGEQRPSARSSATAGADGASSNYHAGHIVFYHSGTMADSDVWRKSARVRESLLGAYDEFVQSRRHASSRPRDAPAQPGHEGESDKPAEDWLEYFRLTETQARAQMQPGEDAAVRLGFQRLARAAPKPASIASASPAPAPSVVSMDCLKNYPRLPQRGGSVPAVGVEEPAATAPAVTTSLHCSLHHGCGRAEAAARAVKGLVEPPSVVSVAAVDGAVRDAFVEASSGHPPITATSPLLGIAKAAEDAVAYQREQQRQRSHSAPLAWSPELLLNESLAASAEAGFRDTPDKPRRVRRVRLQPPPELRDEQLTSHALLARVQRVMRGARTADHTLSRSVPSHTAPLPPQDAVDPVPTLSAPKSPRKVARPTRRSHTTPSP